MTDQPTQGNMTHVRWHSELYSFVTYKEIDLEYIHKMPGLSGQAQAQTNSNPGPVFGFLDSQAWAGPGIPESGWARLGPTCPSLANTSHRCSSLSTLNVQAIYSLHTSWAVLRMHGSSQLSPSCDIRCVTKCPAYLAFHSFTEPYHDLSRDSFLHSCPFLDHMTWHVTRYVILSHGLYMYISLDTRFVSFIYLVCALFIMYITGLVLRVTP